MSNFYKILAVLIPLIAAVIQLIVWISDLKENHLYLAIIISAVSFLVLIASFIWIVVVRFLKKYRDIKLELEKVREGSRRGAVAVQEITKEVTDGQLFAEFLLDVLFAENRIDTLRKFQKEIHLKQYKKDFRILGCDIVTTEHYFGVNVGEKPLSGIDLVSFGGSALRIEGFQRIAQQKVESDWVNSRLDVNFDNERIKIQTLCFNEPVSPGNIFEVRYEETWPGAMVFPGTDALFYTQVLYYRSVDELSSRISFDSDVNHYASYAYDLDEETCEMISNVTERLKEAELKDIERIAFQWELRNPDSNKLYFFVFNRPE